ncbi:hypothetical protein CQW23_13353 [Capsicum baccatum]|uniref:Protein-tyrosine-phosphatase MKP1 C-terminal domain-containing protein n=1 Tax=Capsicum baccatum TaxID=33114 RepID=A0A2G2WV79_CAPBA|nr:hypothetical protein CQW23_13353 [Capsicum baccatum]
MEGEEPLYFWDAFSNFLPLTEKLKNGGDAVESSSKVCPGERKVDAYNVDFEIFQIATSGGFVPPFASCNPSDKEAAVFGGFHELWEKKRCNERSSALLDGVVDTGGACCNLVKPVVYRWPSLEKLATCSIDALDSKGAYIFIIPTSGFGKDAGRAVYVWVGRSFSCDFSKLRQVDCKRQGDPGEIDWKQVASEFLHQIVLPIDTNIKEAAVTSCQRWFT